MDGQDLRKFQEGGEEHDKIRKLMGKIVSGRDGYEAVIERRQEQIKRCACGYPLMNAEKFCPECGSKC